MPIYEYICKACGNEFEKLTTFSSKESPSCPKCESTDLKKKISMTATGKSNCGSCASTSCSSHS